jgi:hypothetical protein
MAAFEWMELQTLTSDITDARARLAEARSTKDHRRVRALEQEISSAERRRAGLLAFLTDHLADTALPTPSQGADEDAEPAPTNDDSAAITADESTPVTAEEGAAIAADESTAVAADEDMPVIADEGAAIAADEGTAVAADEDMPVIADEGAAVAADEGTAVVADEGTPVAADEIARPTAPDPADRTGLYAALAADATDTFSLKGDGNVWEQLTPGDIERAEQELTKRREEMLARHTEELKTLETERDRLATLEQAIAEFLRSFGSPAGGEVVQLGDEREMRAGGRG